MIIDYNWGRASTAGGGGKNIIEQRFQQMTIDYNWGRASIDGGGQKYIDSCFKKVKVLF